MRGDLPPGVQAAMLVHAAGESSPGDLPDGTFAIALEARDEAGLLRLSEELSAAGVRHRVVHEADAPYAGQAMAVGVCPARRDRVRNFLCHLPLVGRGRKPRES